MTTPGRREDPSSRRMIDLATGILMGLRGCSARDAFDDLVKAVHQTGIGPAALATALAHLVGGKGDGVPHQAEAALIWGHLLAARVASTVSAAVAE
ncbi:ANTAR domain-containing protein [Mycobacterium hodleri]|uniref:ANTAR domain-containing protein n=1 Tax=Mycolicibacterium hodleri TaxID=49897 RepID=A0A544VRL9_9MYCO|nr:ANTAR domain-containing protein [Mycolicibacterium hodleri]TQR82632.1 ANTAR domain-containing protein [Mycolicibacterium hodleri]